MLYTCQLLWPHFTALALERALVAVATATTPQGCANLPKCGLRMYINYSMTEDILVHHLATIQHNIMCCCNGSIGTDRHSLYCTNIQNFLYVLLYMYAHKPLLSRTLQLELVLLWSVGLGQGWKNHHRHQLCLSLYETST